MNSTRNRVTLGHKNDRKSGNAPWSRNSQVKNLLAEEKEDTPDVKIDAQQIAMADSVDLQELLSKLTIDFDEYAYPREKAVPEDCYFSTIAGMNARLKDGRVVLDVDYDIEDRYGAIRKIRQSYPVGSQPYQKFSEAMVAAGLNKGQHITDAVGTTEMIRIGYVSKNSDLGSIVERKPYVIPPEDDDSEFDDCLDDLDE